MKVLARSGDPSSVEVLAADEPASSVDIDALYAEHARFLARVIARLTGDGAHVDDLIQETFIVAFKKRATYDATRSTPRTWLYGIAARLAMRHRRGVGRWLRAVAGLADEPARTVIVSPDREIDRERARVTVQDVLATLPFKQREVFTLYELEEIEGAEIAQLLGIPVNTVWTRLHHARKRFEETMRKRIERPSIRKADDHVA
jgi:RNA polymerase sigma factor (sigma-70 family)